MILILIYTGPRLSIINPHMFDNPPEIVVIRGISTQKLEITESTLIYQRPRPHKNFIPIIDNEFDG